MATSYLILRQAQIYKLVNPLNDKIFYVGSTRGPIKAALRRHISPNAKIYDSRKRDMVKSILSKGKEPLIVVVEKCPIDQQHEREKYWRYRLAKHNPLTNACGIC